MSYSHLILFFLFSNNLNSLKKYCLSFKFGYLEINDFKEILLLLLISFISNSFNFFKFRIKGIKKDKLCDDNLNFKHFKFFNFEKISINP